MLFRTLIVSALALLVAGCRPLCHKADSKNSALTAESGGDMGVPLYCGYSRGANCFYPVKGGELNYGPDECPEKSLGECP